MTEASRLVSILLPGMGLIGGLSIGLCLWRRRGQQLRLAFLLMAWAAPLILLGGKALYILERGRSFNAALWAEPGYSLFGSFSMVVAFWALAFLVKRFPILEFFDCVTPGAAFALLLGRINCFLEGCCGGTVCNWPWAVRFPAGSQVFSSQMDAGLVSSSSSFSLPAHPTQIYEAAFALIFGLVLVVMGWRRNVRPGVVFFTGVLGYSLFRLAVEPLRIHPADAALLGAWTLAQVLSAGLAVTALVWLSIRRLESQTG